MKYFMMAILAASAIAGVQDDWKAPSRAAKKKNPIPADEKSIAVGKEFYARECLSCHGNTGKGDGSAAKDLEKHPGDFTSAKFAEQTDGAIFWKTTEGKKPMPSFEKLLTDEQRWHIVNYLRTLGPRRSDDPEKPTAPELEVPDSFREKISTVLSSYGGVHEALASDDLAAAQAKSQRIAEALAQLSKLDAESLNEPVRAAWRERIDKLAASSKNLVAAKTLETFRQQFAEASEQLIRTVQKFGHAQDQPVRVLKCDMAFDGKGARWLQQAKEPANPYFGATMARCGKPDGLLGAKQ